MASEEPDPVMMAIVGVTLLFALLICCPLGMSWNSAVVQAEVYKRNGIEMSAWEVWCGAKPPVRIIELKGEMK